MALLFLSFQFIFLTYSTYVVDKSEESYVAKCHEIINGNGQKFATYWQKSMSVVPKFIYVEYEISDIEKSGKLILSRKFDAKLTEELCPDSMLIFPNILTETQDKLRLVVKVFHGRGDFKIDYVVADVKFKFPAIKEKLKGLSGILMLPIEFSNTVKDIPQYKISDHSYYKKLPHLKGNEQYCVTSIDATDVFTLRIHGESLRNHGAFDHYLFKLFSHTEKGQGESKIFLVKTFICDNDTPVQHAKIFSDYSFTKMSILAMDGYARQTLKASYTLNKHHYFLEEEGSTFEIDSFDFKQEDVEYASIKPDTILFYPTAKKRFWCTKIDWISYVEVGEYEDTVVQMMSFIGDHSGLSDKIIKIRPGTFSEIEDCMK